MATAAGQCPAGLMPCSRAHSLSNRVDGNGISHVAELHGGKFLAHLCQTEYHDEAIGGQIPERKRELGYRTVSLPPARKYHTREKRTAHASWQQLNDMKTRRREWKEQLDKLLGERSFRFDEFSPGTGMLHAYERSLYGGDTSRLPMAIGKRRWSLPHWNRRALLAKGPSMLQLPGKVSAALLENLVRFLRRWDLVICDFCLIAGSPTLTKFFIFLAQNALAVAIQRVLEPDPESDLKVQVPSRENRKTTQKKIR